jgi:(p)ppGpp synthase/HD superfamily hydrolase
MYFDDIRQEFFAQVEKLEDQTRDSLHAAYSLAEKEHAGQLRKLHKNRNEQDPYLIHPMRVALILLKEAKICDRIAVSSAVLHDVVEDGNSNPTIEDIAAAFGKDIAETVNYLTKPDQEEGDFEALNRYHESFFNAPLLVRLVKLSDRLDNIRETLLIDRPKFQIRYLKETREVYLPLAKSTSLYYAAELSSVCDKLESLISAGSSQ